MGGLRVRPSPADIADDGSLIKVFKALAAPQRLRMIQELAVAGELSCGQICARIPLSQPTISHHLKILSEARLLVVRREGHQAFVSLNEPHVGVLLSSLPARLLTGLGPAAGRPR